MSIEPQTFSDWWETLPVKVARPNAELAWRTAWLASEEYSESLYVEMIAIREGIERRKGEKC